MSHEDWDLVCLVLVSSAVACCGVAVVLYSIGFLLHALNI
jgi:hypothetical protein